MADKKEYIERGALGIGKANRDMFADPKYADGWNSAIEIIETAPAADVVSKGVYEQVQWERDMAMQQLEEHGIPFCGKADDVVEVVRCAECKYVRLIVDIIGNPNLYCGKRRDYPNVDFDDFCSWGKRKEQT